MNEDPRDCDAIAPGHAPDVPPRRSVDEPERDLPVVTLARTPELGDDPAMRLLLPVGRSGWAIAAGYLALFSVLCIPAPFALLAGILATAEMRRDPSKHGMGRALFGIVMGTMGTACLWLGLTAMAVNRSGDPNVTAFVVRQLALHGMELLVAAIGIILSLARLRRYPGPAGMTASASALLLAATIGTTLYQAHLVAGRPDQFQQLVQQLFDEETFQKQMAWAAQIGAALRAVALALLVGAVFTGRKRSG